MTINDVASVSLAWAKTDRSADERAAELDRIEREIVLATDTNAPEPQRQALLADRDTAVLEFRRACRLENEAVEAMKAAAHALLEQSERE